MGEEGRGKTIIARVGAWESKIKVSVPVPLMTGRTLFGVMAETIADNSSVGYCVSARVPFVVF